MFGVKRFMSFGVSEVQVFWGSTVEESLVVLFSPTPSTQSSEVFRI